MLSNPIEIESFFDESNIAQSLYPLPFGGALLIYAFNQKILRLEYSERAFDKVQCLGNANDVIENCIRQLDEYFIGKRKTFDLPIQTYGPPFSSQVWQHLAKIPFGTTVSYQDIAKKMGKPKSARAVGQACHNNPLPIIIPCHRVLSSSGKMTGYAYGIDKKEWLLAHENAL